MLTKNQLAFPRNKRLITRHEYSQVFDKAKKFSSGPFVFLVRPNQLEQARLGVVLSKRKVRLAVQRNRVRRLIRESFRTHDGLGGGDIVVIARSDAASMSNHQLVHVLNREWQKCMQFLNQSSYSC